MPISRLAEASSHTGKLMNNTIAKLIQRRNRARARFARIGDLQPGTLQENYTRCGKPNCACATDDRARHGPHYLINCSIEGNRRSLRLRADEIDEARTLLDEYQLFRQVSAEFLKASEELSNARRERKRAQSSKKKRCIKR